MRKPRKSGLSLLETVLSFFLFALFILVFSRVVQHTQTSIRHAEGRNRSLKTCQWAMMKLREDVQAAFEIDLPIDGGTSNRLELRTLKDDPARLPLPYPNPYPPSFLPDDPLFLVELDFFCDSNKHLIRSLDGVNIVLASQTQALKVTRDGSTLELVLTLQELRRTVDFTTRVSRW